MKSAYAFLIIILPLIFSCSSDSKKASADKDNYEKMRQELREKEEKDPRTFLLVNGDSKKNLIGQTVVKGNITNKASVAVFKDVDVNLSFYSKTNALLETDKETIFEIVHPGETKNFKTKYFAPKGTDSVAFTILTAKVVKE